MGLKDRYFELNYSRRITEYKKIDQYKNWTPGQARKTYDSINDFYLTELEINVDELKQLKIDFKMINDFYSKYFSPQRQDLFENYEYFLKWYNKKNESCHYCGITQTELHRIVESRNGYLTLNKKQHRSKGTLEIERLNPSLGYTYVNSVLSCPFCNNAKSNLISEDDWRKFFVPAMKNYFKSILKHGNR